jgi:cytochrome c556
LEANLHFRVCVAALLVTWAGSLAIAQKVTTPEELDKTMKKVQTANQAALKAIKSSAYPDAVKHLQTVKQAMVDSQEFWIQHKKDDALKANKDVIAKLDAAEKVLTGTPDPNTAVLAIKEVGAACRTCHENYRVRDADNNWVLKPGSVGD